MHKIYIDAGHQGEARAIWPPLSKAPEADENIIAREAAIRLSQSIKRWNDQQDKERIQYFLRRPRAQANADRGLEAHTHGCTVAICLHADTNPVEGVRGLVAYCDGDSLAPLARGIMAARTPAMRGKRLEHVDARTTPWADRALNLLCYYSRQRVAAILIEVGFISNAHDRHELAHNMQPRIDMLAAQIVKHLASGSPPGAETTTLRS